MPNLNRHIDINDPANHAFLDEIQGNILKGHGREYSANIFLTLGENPAAARQWISAFAGKSITSALGQRRAAAAHQADEPSGTFAVLGLAQTGYTKLGIAPGKAPTDVRFRYGMKAVRNSRPGVDPDEDYPLNDIPVSDWEPYYRSSLDVAIILADDDQARLGALINAVLQQCAPFTAASHVERGGVMRRNDLPIEHFGFVDGISQPLFYTHEIKAEIEACGAKFWNPEAPLHIVLAPDFEEAESCGSYLVFRKLEQNVSGFAAATARLAEAAYLPEEQAAALVVGRTRDGKPLVRAATKMQGAIPNDFQYDQDVYGMACPYHAHIRKANPRGDIFRRYQTLVPDLDFVAFERNKRLARRGVTYGDRPDLRDPSIAKPTRGVGLLFMAYSSRIYSFEVWQNALDDEHFIRDEIGIDPLAGRQTNAIPQTWPTSNGNLGSRPEDPGMATKSVKFRFGAYVTLKGGEYFFTPSIPYLKALNA